MTKVFINKNYELNTKGEGRLASLNDLEEDICLGGEPFTDIIEVTEGVYQWFDFTEFDDMDFMGYHKVAADCNNNKIHRIA